MAQTPRFRAPALLAALALGAVGCQELPVHHGDKVQVLERGALEDRNPADVVVAPVELDAQLQEAGVRVPDQILREVISEALVKRHYSPLSLDFVDSRVVDASYRGGSLGEDAVCRIVVHRWDERLWETGRMLDVDVELRLQDAQDPSGGTLWSARFPGRIDATGEESHVTEAAMYRWAVSQVGAELAGALPPRTTAPGRD